MNIPTMKISKMAILFWITLKDICVGTWIEKVWRDMGKARDEWEKLRGNILVVMDELGRRACSVLCDYDPIKKAICIHAFNI